METVRAIERQVNMMRKQTEVIISKNKDVWDSLTHVEHVYVYGCSLSDVDLPFVLGELQKLQTTERKAA